MESDTVSVSGGKNGESTKPMWEIYVDDCIWGILVEMDCLFKIVGTMIKEEFCERSCLGKCIFCVVKKNLIRA